MPIENQRLGPGIYLMTVSGRVSIDELRQVQDDDLRTAQEHGDTEFALLIHFHDGARIPVDLTGYQRARQREAGQTKGVYVINPPVALSIMMPVLQYLLGMNIRQCTTVDEAAQLAHTLLHGSDQDEANDHAD